MGLSPGLAALVPLLLATQLPLPVQPGLPVPLTAFGAISPWEAVCLPPAPGA